MTKLNYEEMLVVIRPDSPAMLSSCAYFKTTCSLALTCVAATALEVVTVTLKLLSSLRPMVDIITVGAFLVLRF